jgi:hypothetical protein
MHRGRVLGMCKGAGLSTMKAGEDPKQVWGLYPSSDLSQHQAYMQRIAIKRYKFSASIKRWIKSV